MKKNCLIFPKKALQALLLLSFMAMTLLGCSNASKTESTSSGTNEETTVAPTTEAATVATFGNGLSENDFEIQDYILVPWFSEKDTHYLAVIKNNSEESIGFVLFDVTAYDSNDKVIGTATVSGYNLGPGEETISFCIFENSTNVDHVTRELSACNTGSFTPIYGTLESKTQTNEDLGYPEISITNNGKNTVNSINVFMLFFDKEGKLVNYTIADYISSLSSGATKTAPYLEAVSYDSVRFYYAKM